MSARDSITPQVNLLKFMGADSATDIEPAFRKAIAYCKSNGTKLLTFPKGSFTARKELVCDAPGLFIDGTGAEVKSIDPTISCFQIRNADGSRMANLSIALAGQRSRLTSAYEGSPGRDRVAGIYVVDSDGVAIDAVRTTNYNDGIYLRGRLHGGRATGLSVSNVRSDHCDMGILFAGQDQLTIRNSISYDTTEVQGIQPHAIYGSRVSGDNGLITCRDIKSGPNTFDSCFKFKNCHLDIDGMSGTGARILPIFDTCSGSAKNLVLDGQTISGADGNEAVFLLLCHDMTISKVRISQVPGYNGRGIRVDKSQNCKISDALVTSNRKDASGYSPYTCDGSEGVVWDNCRYRDIGNVNEQMFRIANSTDVDIISPEASGTREIVIMTGTTSRCRARLDRSKLHSGFSGRGWRNVGTGGMNAFYI
jgi:hypothetical protein